MSAIQITSRETLSAQKYPLKHYTYQQPDGNGQMQELASEVYHRPDAVAVLLYNIHEEKFVLTRQFRLPSYLNGNHSGYLTETCAGLIDEGETPEQTAIREVKEELGYQISNLTKVGAVYTSAGGITEYLHLFISPIDDLQNHGIGGGLAEEGEDIETIILNFDKAHNLLKHGKLNDSKTVMLLQHYFLFH